MQHDDDALRFASAELQDGDKRTALQAEAAKLRVKAAQLRAGGRLALALRPCRPLRCGFANSPDLVAATQQHLGPEQVGPPLMTADDR